MKLLQNDLVIGAKQTAWFSERQPPQVLVVDDSSEIREYIGALVSLSGFRILNAEDGLAAQRIMKKERPVLVISDLEMPVCDGWDILAYCHSQHPEIPVLIVSGMELGQRPEIERWAAGYLPKPFSIEQFYTEIQRLVFKAA